MSFVSFVFPVFLAIAFCLYWFVFGRNLRWQNAFVVLASYVFYGWWDWRFLILIAFTTLCSWACGLLIGRFRGSPRKARVISAANIVVNLGILALFKYYDFFAQSFADMFLGGRSEGLLLHLVLPVGISFYTFQALSYSIDVYRGRIDSGLALGRICAEAPAQRQARTMVNTSFFIMWLSLRNDRFKH